MAKGTHLSCVILKWVAITYIQTEPYRFLQKNLFLRAFSFYIETHTIMNYEKAPWIILYVWRGYIDRIAIILPVVVRICFQKVGSTCVYLLASPCPPPPFLKISPWMSFVNIQSWLQLALQCHQLWQTAASSLHSSSFPCQNAPFGRIFFKGYMWV